MGGYLSLRRRATQANDQQMGEGRRSLASQKHLEKLMEGVPAWNAWRVANRRIQPNLTKADLRGRDLTGIDFRGAGLFKAKMHNAVLVDANLRQARLVQTELDGANLSGASVYGASVWDVSLTDAVQRDLIITPPGESLVAVDDLEVAQFIYLLLNNQKLRSVIDTIVSKVVLVLGRFSTTRKPILELIRAELRRQQYLPVLFDFRGPDSRNLTETVSTLAHLARFVIADLTDPSCIPHELQAIAPHVRVPIATLIQEHEHVYAMFDDLLAYGWVISPRTYKGGRDMRSSVLPALIKDAEEKRGSMMARAAP